MFPTGADKTRVLEINPSRAIASIIEPSGWGIEIAMPPFWVWAISGQ